MKQERGGKQYSGRSRSIPETKESPTMREEIQARLVALRKELEKGQAELQKVEAQRTYLRETVLRIDGAIQVLEELVSEGRPTEQSETVPGENGQPSSGSTRTVPIGEPN